MFLQYQMETDMAFGKCVARFFTMKIFIAALVAVAIFSLPSLTVRAAGPITVVNNEVAVVANGKCSLIEALLNANDTVSGLPYSDCSGGDPNGPDVIRLPNAGLFLLTQPYTSPQGGPPGGPVGLPAITSDITIQGNGSSIRRDARSTVKFRLFTVLRSELTLRNVNLQSGDFPGPPGGGGIYVLDGRLSMSNSQMLNNRTDTNGGAILAEDATIVLANSRLFQNAAGDGGAIYLLRSNIQVTRSELHDNIAGANGAGLFLRESSLLFSESTLNRNRAAFRGGGLFSSSFSLATFESSRVAENRADHSDNALPFGAGGGAYNDLNSHLIITRSTFSGNIANGSGGAVHVEGTDGENVRQAWLTASNSTFSDNQALRWRSNLGEQSGDGGAISSDSGSIYLGNNTITANSASGRGDGVFLYAGDAVIERNLISGNGSKEITEIIAAVGGGFNVYGHDGLTTAGSVNVPLQPTDRTATSDGTDPTTLNNILDPILADNGGPTPTHALFFGSPAVDIGPNADCNAVDQRGRPRNIDSDNVLTSEECDAGSFELSGQTIKVYVGPRGKMKMSGPGLDLGAGDIVAYDSMTRQWQEVFDAMAVGIKKNIGDFGLSADGSILLTFPTRLKLPALGVVTPWDVVSFNPATGAWGWVLRGGTAGLSTGSERIDAIATAPDGRLVISTTGKATVPLSTGANQKIGPSDLIVFTPTPGTTGGSWSLMLDGSVIPGLERANIAGASIDPATGGIYLLFRSNYNIGGVAGTNRELIVIGRGPENTYTVEKAPFSLSVPGFDGVPDGIEVR